MSEQQVAQAVTGGASASTDTMAAIGAASKKLDEITEAMKAAKTEDTARFDALAKEQKEQADTLQTLKAKFDDEQRDAQLKAAIEAGEEMRKWRDSMRSQSKAGLIGDGSAAMVSTNREAGAFIKAIMMAGSRDAEEQAEGKAKLKELGSAREEAWGKATLGTSDATGGWIIDNNPVEELIKPATYAHPWRQILTVVPGVTAAGVDQPVRYARPTRATIQPYGEQKELVNLGYDGYTATMYTLARIYDLGKQFVRQSAGAAERDVLGELGTAFALGEAYYIVQGAGSNQPYGLLTALTNAPSTFTSSFTPNASTLAGSIAAAIATCGGALAGREVRPTAAVMSATSYWAMLAQGTDEAGFFFNPSGGPTAINGVSPGTLISPFGIPVYGDSQFPDDDLIVGNYKALKLYTGESYRVDTSDIAGERWDKNLVGFRGEEEIGLDARPAVYAGNFQKIDDIIA